MNARKLRTDELNRLDPAGYARAEKVPLTVILDNIRSMHNVGAVFRTADAFRITEVILCGFTPHPPHRDIRKVALGAEETVKWSARESALHAVKELKEQGYHIVSIEQTSDSQSIQDFVPDLTKSYAVVLGNEVEGVNQEVIALSDSCVEIPQFGTKHSLNVSVCGGIVLWELSKNWLHRTGR